MPWKFGSASLIINSASEDHVNRCIRGFLKSRKLGAASSETLADASVSRVPTTARGENSQESAICKAEHFLFSSFFSPRLVGGVYTASRGAAFRRCLRTLGGAPRRLYTDDEFTGIATRRVPSFPRVQLSVSSQKRLRSFRVSWQTRARNNGIIDDSSREQRELRNWTKERYANHERTQCSMFDFCFFLLKMEAWYDGGIFRKRSLCIRGVWCDEEFFNFVNYSKKRQTNRYYLLKS